MIPRFIPSLTHIDGQLYRTKGFKNPSYVGDPINAVSIFNDKQVDELFIFDIGKKKVIQNKLLAEDFRKVTEQAFMPVGYGGGIYGWDEVKAVFDLGFDKVLFSTSLLARDGLGLIRKTAEVYGVQSIGFSLDVFTDRLGRRRLISQSFFQKSYVLDDLLEKLVNSGVGEMIVRDVVCDGHSQGMNLDLISEVSDRVNIPVIAAGGCRGVIDMVDALKAGAQSVTAGNVFVYQGRRSAVLISYPDRSLLDENLLKVKI